MKLKYYLRGLGIGIFVTALIMSIALGGKEKLSDEEIIARAKALGMVENEEEGTVWQNIQKETGGTEGKEESDVRPESENEEMKAASETEETEPVKPQETAENPETSDGEQAENDGIVAGQVVSVTIVDGDDSASVSWKMEEVGLVVSSSSFDKYLCDNGYAKKLSPGTYEIAIGASEETIAKTITKTK